MTKEQKQQWVDALRSGKYKQGKNHLKIIEFNFKSTLNERKYCCLGVAYDLGLCEPNPNHPNKLLSEDFLDYKTQKTLTNMNDKESHSFAEIADYIEANL